MGPYIQEVFVGCKRIGNSSKFLVRFLLASGGILIRVDCMDVLTLGFSNEIVAERRLCV